MSQLTTATFINESWPVTWLTPTVTIYEALTWNSVWVFDMSETSPWNYIYYWNDWSDNVVYFFNYDAGADVINRYMANNNRIETAVNVVGGWWWSTTYNNMITKDKMKEIAKIVVEMLPEQKEIELDTSKIEEKLVVIEDKIDLSDTEFDYGKILSWQDKNTSKIIKKVESIKIPEQDNTKVLKAIDWVSGVVEKMIEKDIVDIKELNKNLPKEIIKANKKNKDERKLWKELLSESEKDAICILKRVIKDKKIFNSLLD